MGRAWLAPILLLASCGDREADPMPPDRAQIERLAAPKAEEPVDPLVTARLQPIEPGQLAEAGMAGPGCTFRSGEDLLLATGGSDAIARIGGEIAHLVHSGPVGPSGGFFEDRSISISIGRKDEGTSGDRVAALPAKARVTHRRTGAETRIDGVWTCTATRGE